MYSTDVVHMEDDADSVESLAKLGLKRAPHGGEMKTFDRLVREAVVNVYELRSKHLTKESEGPNHKLTPIKTRRTVLGDDDGGNNCNSGQELPQTKGWHNSAEKLRRNNHTVFLAMLSCFCGDVMERLGREDDSSRVWEFERYLPRDILGESKAKNKKEGPNKNLSFVAAIIKMMMLLETQEFERQARKELEARAEALEHLLQRCQAQHCCVLAEA